MPLAFMQEDFLVDYIVNCVQFLKNSNVVVVVVQCEQAFTNGPNNISMWKKVEGGSVDPGIFKEMEPLIRHYNRTLQYSLPFDHLFHAT